MKKMLIAVVTCFTLITLLASTCRKSDAPAPGPDVLVINEGFISTKTGINVGNLGDTSYMRISGDGTTGGYCRMASTLYGASVENKDYYVKFERAGNGNMYIKCIINGLYLGVRESGQSAGYYSWCTNWPTLDKQPGEKNEFIVKKKDNNHFTVESALIRGTFMNTTTSPQISYTGPKSADEIHFLAKEQEWFFLKPF